MSHLPDTCGGEPGVGPRFDAAVPNDGYLWWYLDALSDDGVHALTVIAFIGSVFSPWYFRARRAGPADPRNHCCLNVVLYGAPRRWAMTERGRDALAQAPAQLTIGPSAMRWEDGLLTIDVNEVCAPVPRRLAGQITVRTGAIGSTVCILDAAGKHRWWPICPSVHVDVAMTRPGLRWSGRGYLDANDGDEPLEAAFSRWQWSGAGLDDGGAAVLYDLEGSDGTERRIALRYRPDGTVEPFDAPAATAALPRSGWRIDRSTRCEDGGTPSVERTLLDAPFYSRSVLRTRLLGQDVVGMHESLDLARFVSTPVQWMLPFRAVRALR